MQENSFEKKVQQKMEELSFEPSAPVWQKVELQIQHKRRRRRLVFLLLPLLLVSAGLAIYVALNKNESTTSVAQAEKRNKVSENAPSVDINAPAISGESNMQKQTAREETRKMIQKEKETFRESAKLNSYLSANDKNLKGQKGKETFLKEDKKVQKHQKTKEAAGNIAEEKEAPQTMMADLHAMVLQNEINKKEKGEKADQNIANPFQKKNEITSVHVEKRADTLAKQIAAAATPSDSIGQGIVSNEKTLMDSVVAVSEKAKENQKVWQWALQARVGFSGLRSEVTDVFGNRYSSDFSSSPASGNNSPQPSRIKATSSNGIAMSFGASLRRQVAKNVFVSAGLQYSYYSHQITVGTQVNRDTTLYYNGRLESIGNYFTSTGTASSYTNRFHYLELPLAFDYSLFKKLQVQHGVSIGRLLASNALNYNATSGFYYRSDNWMRKTSFNLFTSINYRLLQKSNLFVIAGPQLQWALSSVQQQQQPNRQHLFFAGVHTQIHF